MSTRFMAVEPVVVRNHVENAALEKESSALHDDVLGEYV